jgi:hypothetical protein
MRKHHGRIGILTLAMIVTVVTAASAQEQPATPKSRDFVFSFGATVTGLKPGQTARIWVPVPPSDRQQRVKVLKRNLPGQARVGKEEKFGNTILYVEGKANESGTIPLTLSYQIKRWEVKGDARDLPVAKEEIELFLKPDARVPVGGKPAEKLLKDRKVPNDQMQAAKMLYDLVNNYMQYCKKGTGWGLGDANWACDSRYGNCTDFHSLFMSLARTVKIPAKFEIGFALPEKRTRHGEVPGYHCWAWFRPEGRGWSPVDISAANQAGTTRPDKVAYFFGNLTEDRVTFSTGRDLQLVPPQDGPPVNFLIYAYVEVEGRPWPADLVNHRFTFQDID